MQPRIVPGPGDIQYPTHRHHTPYSAVLIDKAVLQSGSLAKYRAAFFRISRSSSVRFSCAPEKAIAYNFDFIPDLESENETK